MKTPALWLLIFALGIGITANGAIGFHQVAYYTDVGMAATAAAVALTTYGISGAFANVIWGYLVERASERHLATVSMVFAALALFYLVFVDSLWMALIFSVLFGLAARGESSLVLMIVAQYYGRNSYGTISGFIGPFQMLGLGLGPLLASISFDVSGSYKGVFVIFSAGYLFAAALMWFARRPSLPKNVELEPGVS
jgi:MFS family permease